MTTDGDRERHTGSRRTARRVRIAGLCALLLATAAWGGPREQAKRLHDRLAGVPPTEAVLDQMAAEIAGGNAIAAAMQAMEHDAFYDVTLKNFAAPWTNEAQSKFVPLNDYIATVIGYVRDERDFRGILSDDLVYVGKSDFGLPAYSVTSNAHYEAMEAQGLPLQNVLEAVPQSSVTGLPPAATAGITTTRAAAEAFFVAGTNRAMFRFTLLNHLCTDLEQLKDITRPADRIRQDVSRSPGGDSRIFLNSCIGCHAGMDGLAGAYAYYDWDGSGIVYTPGQVTPKHLINADVFKYGYVTTDDSWVNYWREGRNARLGWPDGTGWGNGAKSLGQELAGTDAFATCQVKKVFETVCLRPPADAADRAEVDRIASAFKTDGNLKQVFAETAVWCMGD